MAEGKDNKDQDNAFGDCTGGEKDEGKLDLDLSKMDKLRKLFATNLDFGTEKDEPPRDKVLEDMSLSGIAKYIENEKCKNIVVMCGAGVSTSAGIPDFRSPGSGLYDNLEEYDLPDPQAIFEISFFRTNPKPFYDLAKKLLPVGFKPTPCHYFMRLLHEKGKLLRVYTQNIDTMERLSGIPGDKIVEAHGTFYTSHCIQPKCWKEFSLEWMRENIDDVPKCPDCGSYIKPDIVFFGENLPPRFFHLASSDFPKCDLLIVLGTSLVVQPFASLIDRVEKSVPRLLINKEKVGQADSLMKFLGLGSGLEYDSATNYRDVAWVGLCDEGCQLLADKLGWGDELKKLIMEEYKKIDDDTKERLKQKTDKTG